MGMRVHHPSGRFLKRLPRMYYPAPPPLSKTTQKLQKVADTTPRVVWTRALFK